MNMTFSHLELLAKAGARRRAADFALLASACSLGAASGFGSKEAASRLQKLVGELQKASE
jgi:hypothetical protein